MDTPAIESDGWGSITVDGATFKDAVLGPGIARGWDWDDDGTSHAAMAVAPVRELVEAGATRRPPREQGERVGAVIHTTC